MRALRELPTTNLSLTDFGWTATVLSRMLIGLLIAIILSLFFVPWQQSVRGSGQVIAYAALERQQTVQAPIEGRVVRWFVQEGDQVKAGTTITELSDNDPNILKRLQREYDAVKSQVDATNLSINSFEGRIASLRSARTAALSNAQQQVRIAEEKRRGAERKVDAARAALKTAEVNVERQRGLHEKGLVSTRTLELAELAFETAKANLDRELANLNASGSDVQAQSANSTRIGSGEQASIESAQSSLQSLYASRAKAEAELAKVETRLARQQSMQIEAPRDGTVMRYIAREGGEIVKAGDPLFVFVPDTVSRAVEVWVDGNDAPLITKGRHVRLQFEGWPAVQFVGWPSVAVGTFGGKLLS